MVIPPGEVQDEDDEESIRTDVTCADHPLSSNPDSQWQAFFRDNEVLLQIDKDVRYDFVQIYQTNPLIFYNLVHVQLTLLSFYSCRRLCPDISFFQQATEAPCDKVVNSRGLRRLHRRVQHTVLSSANVERRGLGVTKVGIKKIIIVLNCAGSFHLPSDYFFFTIRND